MSWSFQLKYHQYLEQHYIPFFSFFSSRPYCTFLYDLVASQYSVVLWLNFKVIKRRQSSWDRCQMSRIILIKLVTSVESLNYSVHLWFKNQWMLILVICKCWIRYWSLLGSRLDFPPSQRGQRSGHLSLKPVGTLTQGHLSREGGGVVFAHVLCASDIFLYTVEHLAAFSLANPVHCLMAILHLMNCKTTFLTPL